MVLMLRTAVTGSGDVCEGGTVAAGGITEGGDVVAGDVGPARGPFGSVNGMQRQH
jgi:hypothetical protein